MAYFKDFKPNNKGYNHMYDGLPQYSNIFLKLSFIFEMFAITVGASILLIIPFTIKLTNYVLQTGSEIGYDSVASLVIFRAILTSFGSLMITLPYAFIRYNRLGKKAYLAVPFTIILLSIVLSFYGFFLSAFGFLGIN